MKSLLDQHNSINIQNMTNIPPNLSNLNNNYNPPNNNIRLSNNSNSSNNHNEDDIMNY